MSDEDMILRSSNVCRILDDTPKDYSGVIVNSDVWMNLSPFSNELRMMVLPNAGCMAIRIAFAVLGYDEIAFVGCDCRYKNDEESNKHLVKKGGSFRSTADYDVNHFRDDYFGENITFGVPNEKEVIYMWERTADMLPMWRKGFKRPLAVYSCTPNSNANEYYPYIPLEKFVTGTRESEPVTLWVDQEV